MDKIRLVLGCEDISFRKGLCAIFASESMFEIVGGYPVAEAIDRSIAAQPDVVLIDASINILEYKLKIAQLKNECPCSLVLIFIGDDQYDLLTEIVVHGVDGFIPKGIMRGWLVKAVELICRAGVFCLPGQAKKKISFRYTEKSLSLADLKIGIPGSNEFLTRREIEVLELMARNLSNRQIANALYISEPTVKTHVSSILRKLRLNNRAQAIVYTYQSGLLKDIHVNSD